LCLDYNIFGCLFLSRIVVEVHTRRVTSVFFLFFSFGAVVVHEARFTGVFKLATPRLTIMLRNKKIMETVRGKSGKRLRQKIFALNCVKEKNRRLGFDEHPLVVYQCISSRWGRAEPLADVDTNVPAAA
jgi:hypothetical protein